MAKTPEQQCDYAIPLHDSMSQCRISGAKTKWRGQRLKGCTAQMKAECVQLYSRSEINNIPRGSWDGNEGDPNTSVAETNSQA